MNIEIRPVLTFRSLLYNFIMQATRAIIHLDRLRGNFQAIQERVGARHICVPIKADAYGHGAAVIARESLSAMAANPTGDVFFGVARVQEGADLRESGINTPILLFSQPLPDEIPEIISKQLICFVADAEFAWILNQAAGKAGIKLPVHLKIDTGMGRMGCASEDAPALAQNITGCTALELAGTATHLAVSDSAAPEDIAYTRQQIARFTRALDAIKALGLDPGIVHAANSGAIILHPHAWFDMVRPGIILYGYKTAEETNAGLTLPPLHIEPVMELRTNVVLIKQVKKGETISYGRIWTAPHDTSVAVLPVGYADGLPRLASNKWQVLINDCEYPLAGRICMDQCMADIGPDSGVRRWDEVIIFGGPAPDAGDLAGRIGTIPYEICCNINKRVPRVIKN